MQITDYEQGSRAHIVAIHPTTGRYVVGMAPDKVLPPLVKLHQNGRNGRWLDPEGHTWEPYLANNVVKWRHSSTCVCRRAVIVELDGKALAEAVIPRVNDARRTE